MELYNTTLHELHLLFDKLQASKSGLEAARNDFETYLTSKSYELKYLEEVLLKKEVALKKVMKERANGFPWISNALSVVEAVYDRKTEERLKYKKRKAMKTAALLKEYASEKRQVKKENRQLKGIIDYYEYIVPYLVDARHEIIEDNDSNSESLKNFTKNELQDCATQFLTLEEYRKLSPSDRNQLALNRYFTGHKSNHTLGKIYERYIGYLYEKEGYDVNFHGISKHFEDLGRDLICHKEDEVIIIQCKYWSHFKTIHEKHIFQFFGTVFEFQDRFLDKKVEGHFYTSTKLSDLARRFANKLGIKLYEECKLDKSYPCVKCNISGVEKIYHLPFDQQYDTVKIKPSKKEFYTNTCEEAEAAGFRHAYRWIPKT